MAIAYLPLGTAVFGERDEHLKSQRPHHHLNIVKTQFIEIKRSPWGESSDGSLLDTIFS